MLRTYPTPHTMSRLPEIYFSGSLLCISQVRQYGRCVMAGLSLVLRQPIAGMDDVGGNLCLQSVGWVGIVD
ncbi:hypothetical protein [Eikenella corrodens]|uniref:hypothetical protein n=1 Tax=Eikenella corrodens TaxID=539 RepID=UPI0013DFD4A1|nr:hypothetical protein [Eikenella corrodens]